MWSQDHVAFRVSDLDAALEFYVGKLGMKLLFRRTDEEHHETFAFLELNGGNLELLQSLDEHNRPWAYTPPPLTPPYCPHLALRTDDLDLILDRLVSNGIPVVKGPLEISHRVRWLYVADPDHNVIEFVQWR